VAQSTWCAAQAFEAIDNITKECQASLLAYVRTISIDVITPVQVGKMYVEASPFIMDPVKLGAHLSASQSPQVVNAQPAQRWAAAYCPGSSRWHTQTKQLVLKSAVWIHLLLHIWTSSMCAAQQPTLRCQSPAACQDAPFGLTVCHTQQPAARAPGSGPEE